MAENQVNSGHPKGLYVLFVTEMWERFSYYGMRALFILFMTKALLFDKAFGSQIYGSYTGLVYLTPLIGGYVADRYWGNRKSIIVGGIIMAIGQFFMFLSGSFYEEVGFASIMMYTGLGFLIFGNGFFKPNISTMVGQLYPVGDKRVDSAFTIFYMGINLGAFIAPLLCGFFGDTGNPADFKWGFLLACGGMILSVVLFVLLKNKYIVTPEGEQIGAAPNSSREIKEADAVSAPVSVKTLVVWGIIWVVLLVALYFALDKDVIGAFIFSLTLAAPGYIISDPGLTKVERQRIWVIYIVAFFVIFFWSAFEQAGASLTYFAEEQTNRDVMGTTVPASFFQSVNAIAIVIFAPVFVWLWGVLGKRNMEPASPYKQAIGLFLLALGYLVIAFGVKGLEPGIKVSMMWLLSLYTIHTLGELCLSPIGLSMVNKLAPVKFASLLMGVWFLSTAAANKFAGTLSQLYPEAVVSLTTVENIEKEKTLHLFPEGFEKESATEVKGQKVIPFERIDLASISDKDVKENVVKELYGNQVENAKDFMGFSIVNLYDFFMLFVVMAGVASIILFVLSRKLIQMMHGVR
ncbi:peptide MFS transporter [Flavobacterium beibuense]|uniref:Dipeptide/tripeptide permease n=1 Tax=Flavobacterium beibuense TaxID=657326 RepID=A0A444WC11_9FLAO|nr:peptide MFS transporter [Flavobacterium beibuense]RYJ43381.1 Dipeptide/tripeptide permease [Flavobacterium beibuense]